jgi:N-acetyltransferase
MWTLEAARKQGVVSKILDAVRGNHLFGTVLARADLAFSQPTTMGRALAERYTGRPDFLVYS